MWRLPAWSVPSAQTPWYESWPNGLWTPRVESRHCQSIYLTKQHKRLESHLTDLVGRLCEDCLLPQVRGQVAVSLWDGVKGSLGCRQKNQRWAGAEARGRKLLLYKSVRYSKGEQRRPRRQSFCRALQSYFLSLLITTTPPQQRWGWAEQGEKKPELTAITEDSPKFPRVAVQPRAEV